MPISAKKLLLVQCLITCITLAISARHGQFSPPTLTQLTDLFPHLKFNGSYSEFFGGPRNIRLLNNGSRIDLYLDKYSGSGFISKDHYYYGFFSAAIKLPADYSAGVVVAFYMTNADVFPHNHDEIDFEMLGHEKRKEWALQTNVYSNGSTVGREEKFYLWFDPTQQFHQYSILWNDHHIVFLVDNIPVREVSNSGAMSRSYPLKPMSVYSTIWDGSQWATHGGKRPVNYNFAPFVASFQDLEMAGCKWNTKTPIPSCSKNGQDVGSSSDPSTGNDFIKLSQQQQVGMEEVRQRFMFYSYCNDRLRYKVMPPECNEKQEGHLQYEISGLTNGEDLP